MFGLWEPTMETLSLMLVVGRHLRAHRRAARRRGRRSTAALLVLRPVLDAMQTVPSTAYLVPAVLLFGIGQVPAAVATVI